MPYRNFSWNYLRANWDLLQTAKFAENCDMLVAFVVDRDTTTSGNNGFCGRKAP